MALLDFARPSRLFRGGDRTQFHPRVQPDALEDEPPMTYDEFMGRSERNRRQVAELVGQVRGLLSEVDTSDQLTRHHHSILGQLEANPGSHHLFNEVQIILAGLRGTVSRQATEATAAPLPPSGHDLYQAALTFRVAGSNPEVAAILNATFGEEALEAQVEAIQARGVLHRPPAASGDLL